jgi:hypothetical protein
MGFLGYLGWLGTTLVSISNNQEKILHEMSMRSKEKEKMVSVLTKEIHQALQTDIKAKKTEEPKSTGSTTVGNVLKTETFMLNGKEVKFEEYEQMIQQKIFLPRQELEIK